MNEEAPKPQRRGRRRKRREKPQAAAVTLAPVVSTPPVSPAKPPAPQQTKPMNLGGGTHGARFRLEDATSITLWGAARFMKDDAVPEIVRARADRLTADALLHTFDPAEVPAIAKAGGFEKFAVSHGYFGSLQVRYHGAAGQVVHFQPMEIPDPDAATKAASRDRAAQRAEREAAAKKKKSEEWARSLVLRLLAAPLRELGPTEATTTEARAFQHFIANETVMKRRWAQRQAELAFDRCRVATADRDKLIRAWSARILKTADTQMQTLTEGWLDEAASRFLPRNCMSL